MNLFVFMLFMMLVAFAVTVVTYGLVVHKFGTAGRKATIAKYTCVPAAVIGYNMLMLASGDYMYLVGAIPLLALLCFWAYYRFGGSGAFYDAPNPKDFQKPVSKKSERIHAARAKRAQGK
jgi:hypothetical protein